MAIEFLTYDDNYLQPGKFYNVRINKDMATAVIEAPPSPIHFTDASYINEPWNGISSLEIWQVDQYKGFEKHTNITNAVEWYIEKPSNRIVINSNKKVTGYIKFI